MRQAGPRMAILAVICSHVAGCGTMFNLAGEEPWLMGPAPERPVYPFGGVGNDICWMARGGPTPIVPITAASIDMPLSLVGDIVTLPWTTYQWRQRQPKSMTLYFDDDKMHAEVLRHLSIGMPIDDAKRIMSNSGFQCRDSLGWRPDEQCVRCIAKFGSHDFVITDEIEVTLHHTSGSLTHIEVCCRSIGS